MHESPMSPARSAAEAIMNDILTRKGLGDAWSKWWTNVSPMTKDAIFTEWERIIDRAAL